jgi:hypothetical protein
MLCVNSRKSPHLSAVFGWTYINIERIHLVSHPTAAADLNASFTLLVPKELSKMTKSSASVSSLMVITSLTYFLIPQIVYNQF